VRLLLYNKQPQCLGTLVVFVFGVRVLSFFLCVFPSCISRMRGSLVSHWQPLSICFFCFVLFCFGSKNIKFQSRDSRSICIYIHKYIYTCIPLVLFCFVLFCFGNKKINFQSRDSWSSVPFRVGFCQSPVHDIFDDVLFKRLAEGGRKLSSRLPNTSTFVPNVRSQCLYWVLPIMWCAFGAHLDVGLEERPAPCRFIGTVHVSFPRFGRWPSLTRRNSLSFVQSRMLI